MYGFISISKRVREGERIISVFVILGERVYMVGIASNTWHMHRYCWYSDTCARYNNKHIVDVCVCLKSTIIKFVIPKKHDSDISLKWNLNLGIFRFSMFLLRCVVVPFFFSIPHFHSFVCRWWTARARERHQKGNLSQF